MRQYRRSHAGALYFFTLVTHQRRPILTTKLGRQCLRESFHAIREDHPFDIIAIVLLPDHLHAVWELPRGDSDDSMRWRLIKSKFTRLWRDAAGSEGTITSSRQSKGERGIWQRRFYEHTCRDEEDVQRCINYIHVNPLKHGFAERARDWPWSSFHRYVRGGAYPIDWGSVCESYGHEFSDAE